MEFVEGKEPNEMQSGSCLVRITRAKPGTGDGAPVVNLDRFQHWVSRTWYDIVGSGDLRHFRAGTNVQPIQNFRQASAYAAKRYIAKADLPEEIRDAPGRFWGIMERDNAPLGQREVLRISLGDACQLRRLLRRYRRSTAKPEKRRFLRSAQFRDPEFSVTTFLDVEQWYRCITPMPTHFLRAIQDIQQVLPSNPPSSVKPELFEATKGGSSRAPCSKRTSKRPSGRGS